MNKILLALVFLTFLGIKKGTTQTKVTLNLTGNAIASIAPDAINFDDLQFLKQTMVNTRIVMLGEQTHGEGATFSAKIRLIKFFHEQMGFNILAFESGFYDCAKIWEEIKKGKQLKTEAIGSLFYMYATSEQMYPLFDYIQKNIKATTPLKLTGFESQHSGKKSIDELFNDLFNFFKKNNITVTADEKEIIKRLSISNFKSNTFLPDEAEQKKYFDLIIKWRAIINKTSINGAAVMERSDFWQHVLASLASQAYRYWKMRDQNAAENINIRDKQMADNLIWLADTLYKNEKIIVWAHNIHIAKSTSSLQFADTNVNRYFKTLIPMGNSTVNHFGNKAYVMGFTAASGSYMNYADSKIIEVPKTTAGTIESGLSNKGAYYFIDFSKNTDSSELRLNQKARLVDFIEFTAVWPKVFDGLFFIRDTYPVKR